MDGKVRAVQHAYISLVSILHHAQYLTSSKIQSPNGEANRSARRNVKRAVAVVNRAATVNIIRVELHNTGTVIANRNPAAVSVLRCISLSQNIAISIHHRAALRVTIEFADAVEYTRGVPAVTLDGECAAVASVVARGMVSRVRFIVDGVAIVVDDREAFVVSASSKP